MDVLKELKARGFIKQFTDEAGLSARLNKEPLTFYVGFDPTGDSLHVGHLLPVMCAAWLQRAGHRALIILGGGTAMVGDPSGKDKTRTLLTREQVQQNLEGQRPQFLRFLNQEQTTFLDNSDWLLSLNYVEFLRDIGRHFSVNTMIKAEGARQRLERGQGYSFLEFNYHLLQSYDFLHLYKTQQCTVQFGGDDQWFHFCGGVELIRRETKGEAYAFTIPLLATADGKKMGKTERGAVWLDPEKLSPYEFYQYWVNVQDADVIRLMKLFTFMPLEEIETYATLSGAALREAKQRLALEITTLVHGIEAAQGAQDAATALFSGGVSADAPTYQAQLPALVTELLNASDLCKSKGDARRQIQGGAVKVDYGEGKVAIKDPFTQLEKSAVLWVGKKRCVKIEEK